VAAAIGGVACAWLLAPLIGPSLNLAAYSGTGSAIAVTPAAFPLVACAAGLVLGALLVLVIGSPNVWAFAPGLLLIGLGLGLGLTPSVNVIQSSFGENRQSEISGLSRSVSNLGSSLGTAIAGTIIVAGITATPARSYGLAMLVLALIAVAGLSAAAFLPRTIAPADTR